MDLSFYQSLGHYVIINVKRSDPESDIHKERYDFAKTAVIVAIYLVEFGRAAPEKREARYCTYSTNQMQGITCLHFDRTYASF